ncbi:MAG: AAA family ATPase [Candidatus Scalindua rubra]|uniref:Flagellar biosynthesis protein FlhF n=1 Tax=Candidatus Scalindua brodae TaxID=237368 RepID=A0A0B0EMN5_9BACT|nr:MAG: Flagellar biosynthesis protein FlhF [Candidatus Scalindua brodae]MBZ0107213.1 AAA family ATPase [Candidatus Scalindua rubra]TWU31652.1 Flagellar biosynthesis protein FlhF [Candidatus Brocadiaceae bacterium S225]
MRIKSFIATTIQEALKSVKREMGDGSIILETRNIEEGDIKSMKGQTLVEVIAAENNNGQNKDQDGARKEGWDVQGDRGGLNIQPPDQNPSVTSPSDPQQSEQYSSATEHKDIPEDHMDSVILSDHLHSDKQAEPADSTPADRLSEFSGMVQSGKIKQVSKWIVNNKVERSKLHVDHDMGNNGDCPDASEKLFKQLRIQQVEEEHSRLLINNVMSRLSNDEYDKMDLHWNMLRESIIHKIKTSDSSSNNQHECKTKVFIGAAGTGKTTTILKLASDTKKMSDKEILLISIRGHSAEKLKKTADRIGVTLRTVTSHRELRDIIDRHNGLSHIFIDTPGISYLDDNALSSLKGYLDEIPKKETHLVVSATTRYADIINVVNKFTVFPLHRLHFTKVDETCLYGTLFSVAMETQIPLSCISDGQEVPEDLRPVTAEMVADMVLQV